MQLSEKMFCNASTAQLEQTKTAKLPEDTDTPCHVEFLFVLPHSVQLSDRVVIG